MSDVKFFPPQQNPLLVRLLQSFFFLVVYFVYKIRLVISESDVAKVKAIADARVVYLPNHCTLDDGLVVFLLSARIGQMFHYVVALEAFQGIIGKLMQRVGAYSIRRGIGDRYSIVQTLKILQQPQSKLVIFPEGGCSYQNDTVIPFRSGAVELSFKAMEKLVKQNGSVPDFYLVPVSLRYYYPGVTDVQISQALSRLESALSLDSKQDNNYLRLRAIAEQVLINLETEYCLKPTTEADWNQRIEQLKSQMLDYCEQKLDLSPAVNLPNRERVYKVQSLLKTLPEQDKQTNPNYEHVYLTTVRLLNFDAIYDGYVAESPTPERFIATIDRLEREVFQIDKPKHKGRCQAKLKIGDPINLKDHWQKYQLEQQNGNSASQSALSKSIIHSITQTVQKTVLANLK